MHQHENAKRIEQTIRREVEHHFCGTRREERSDTDAHRSFHELNASTPEIAAFYLTRSDKDSARKKAPKSGSLSAPAHQEPRAESSAFSTGSCARCATRRPTDGAIDLYWHH